MFRALTVLGTLTLFAATANAQPGRLPLSPGVVPAAPFGPGFGMVSPNGFQPNMVVGPQSMFFLPVVAPLGFSTYPYSPFVGFGYPSIGYISPGPYASPQLSVPAAPPLRDERNAVLVKEFPATLTLQFPAAAEVWLDGKKVEGTAAEERVLNSPVLKPGETYTFAVKGRWTNGGKTYEATRKLTLNSGDRSRLFIVSGEEVKGGK